MSCFSCQAHDPDFLHRLILFIRAMLAMDLHQPTDWTSGHLDRHDALEGCI